MNILFLTISDIRDVSVQSIYNDLINEFIFNNHNLYVVSPIERKYKHNTHIIKKDNLTILKIKTLNFQKTNIIEKGLCTLLIDYFYNKAINEYFSGINFDLVLYSTPPISFINVIKRIKKEYNAKSYLMLKDIFPQNAVDMNMIKKTGLLNFVYKYFRNKEIMLYNISDYIGCMSQANVDYLIDNNNYLSKDKIGICYNSIKAKNYNNSSDDRLKIRTKYSLPLDKKIFVYGGNLGKLQGIDFFVDSLKYVLNSDNYFLIIGDGTEYYKLLSFMNKYNPNNIKLLHSINRDEYNLLLSSLDFGIILLNYKNTIPNFPSRILTYMQAKLPIISLTDKVTDIGDVIENNNFGVKMFSNDEKNLSIACDKILSMDYNVMSQNSYNYLINHYDIKSCYKSIINHSLNGDTE